MADAIAGDKPIQPNENVPRTIKTFVAEIRKALYDIPGVSKTAVDRLMESQGNMFQQFSRLPHTLPSLSTFLHYNIGVVAYKYGASSPQAYISTFTASPELVAAIIKMSGPDGKVPRNLTISRTLFNPKSEQDKMVTLFDMEARKLVNFAAKEWMILPPPDGFLPLDPKIGDILQEALADIYNPQRKQERRKLAGM